jgi:thiosulfate/3-mercaptopyruvate sulfurtransferase
MSFAHPEYLAQTEWLADHLHDPDLRILDCNTVLHPELDGSYRIESGHAAWAAGHIPGSRHIDIATELSDTTNPLPYMAPSAAQFAEAMSSYGIGEGTRVVLYDSFMNVWATRVWWLLHAFGFDHARVLSGGWTKWQKEGRPVSTDPPTHPRAQFIARPRPEVIANKQEVLAAIGNKTIGLVNALRPEDFAGTAPARYARPGRIPTSVNVPFTSTVDPDTHAYLPAEQLRAKFAAVGATGRDRVITYCAVGLTATSDAFLLTLLGMDNVAVYDGSLTEWAADPNMPMEKD